MADDIPPFRTRRLCATTLAVSGDVDLASAPELRAALADRTVVALDVGAVTFIDAAGLAVLLDARRDRSGGLTLIAPSRCVRRLLGLVGHATTFPVVDH